MKRIGFILGLLTVFFATSIGSPANAWFLGNDKPKTTQSSSSKSTGKTYVNRNSTFDPKAKDAFGMTNVQRMEKGRAPIGKDGKPVHFHLFKQINGGKRVEMMGTELRKVKRYGLKPSEIDKGNFAKERRQHWKDRAKDFK